jgi:hypothetical protein
MDSNRKAEAIAALRREIEPRIAPFCTMLTGEQLDELLDRMAYLQWKYDTLPSSEELAYHESCRAPTP